jgi:integrase
LGTQDWRVARALALQLDAALERCLAMTPPLTPDAFGLTPAGFARLLRDMALAEGDRRRAARSPDVRGIRPAWRGASLPADLAEALEDEADAVETRLAPGEFEASGGVELPPGLADRLMAAVAGIERGRPQRSALAESEGRHLAARGRARMLERALRRNDLARDWTERVVATSGPVASLDPAGTARLALRVLAEVAREEAKRELGEYDDGLRATLASAGSAPAQADGQPAPAALPTAAAVPPPTPVSGSAPVPPSAPHASTLVDEFLATRQAQRGVSHHTIAQDRVTIERFVEIVGDRPVDTYRRADVARFNATMRQLPSNYGKSPKDKGMTVAQLIARADGQASSRLTDKTLKRHTSTLSQWFLFLVDKGLFTMAARAELVSEHHFKLGNPREDRDAWTSDELARLFASPVWTGSHPTIRSRPGSEIFRDAKFWLPLLCAFQGNRLEEFADLRRHEVRCEAGTWCVDITDEHRRLKTNSSTRTVPLHPVIVRLGFLEYVAVVAPGRDDPLFPDLEPQGKDGRRGPRVTRWFASYRNRIGLYREDVAMHAFRHEANTRLRNVAATVQDIRHIDYVFGHSPGGGEGAMRYDKGPGLAAAAATLAKLTYPEIRLEHLFQRAEGDVQAPKDW